MEDALSHLGKANVSWTVLLTNIACLTDTELVHEFGQIAMENGLIVSLSLKTDICFSSWKFTLVAGSNPDVNSLFCSVQWLTDIC